VRADQSVLPLQERLLKQHRVLIRDCLSFGELGDRYLRVAVRTNFENERFLTALQSCWPYDTE
jgi:histidinol-phosphate/aromatic aminotransferase/cobyric acid decarboxylase-like protein